jgi:hypothetical protein
MCLVEQCLSDGIVNWFLSDRDSQRLSRDVSDLYQPFFSIGRPEASEVSLHRKGREIWNTSIENPPSRTPDF